MQKFTSRAQRYRDRADELLAKADDFQTRPTVQLPWPEEYLAMADRVEEFQRTVSPVRSLIDPNQKSN